MNKYRVERYDVSWVDIEANSEEEALDLSHTIDINQWDIDIGESEVYNLLED